MNYISSKKILAGLTGGICCGKSTASKTFQKHNIPVVDADIVARQVVSPGQYGLDGIIDLFGEEMLQSDGTVDRIKLGKLVFSDADAMSKLNHLMMPLIQEEGAKQINKFHNEGHSIVIWDAALICEMGSAAKYNPLIVVHCHRDLQIERLMTRNSLTKAEAMARIDAQFPVSHKLMMADYAVDTSGTIEESVKQVEVIIKVMEASCQS